jgi:SAM-dependent methyltransferase
VGPADAVVWHDLECGSYGADLPLWHELAARQRGPILDIGAGTGRVALELAGAGYEVTALERDVQLLAALRARAASLPVRAVHADARDFRLPPRNFALCIVPMQTIQLLRGAGDRARFLRCVRTSLCAGGLLACALLGQVEPFAGADGDPEPEPETALLEGLLYTSRPTRVAVSRAGVRIERERSVVALSPPAGGSRTQVVSAPELSVEELARVSPRTLKREAAAAGLRAERDRTVAETEDHAGSTVVMLRG